MYLSLEASDRGSESPSLLHSLESSVDMYASDPPDSDAYASNSVNGLARLIRLRRSLRRTCQSESCRHSCRTWSLIIGENAWQVDHADTRLLWKRRRQHQSIDSQIGQVSCSAIGNRRQHLGCLLLFHTACVALPCPPCLPTSGPCRGRRWQ